MTTSMLAHLVRMDERLVRAGFNPLTPWWRREFEAFYSHPTATVWGSRVGRGGAKSYNAVKFSLCETLFGDFSIPPGERHYFAFVSIRESEALERLRLLEAMLKALRVGYDRRGETIELASNPRGFRVFVCNVGSVSGFRCFGYAADELAKWRNETTGQNPAPEVLASIRAMTINHKNARGALISSPLSMLDEHYRVVEQGTTASTYVSPSAPTWVANPSVTREETQRREPDERIWKREYAAIPQSAASAAFDTEAIEAAFRPRPMQLQRGRKVIVLDPSSGRKDAWTWASACLSCAPGQPERTFLEIDDMDGIGGSFWKQLKGSELVEKHIVPLARDCGTRCVHSDQRESLMLDSELARHKLTFVSHVWDNPKKQAAVERLRRRFADREIFLPPHGKLQRELSAFEEKILPSGAITFAGRGTGDDYVALLVTATLAELAGELYAPGWRIRLPPSIDRELNGRDPPLPRHLMHNRWAGMGPKGFG